MNSAPANDSADTPRKISVPLFEDDRGLLGSLESAQFGFIARRFYFLTQTAKGQTRGHHAHKALRQCLFAQRGSVTIDLENRDGETFTFTLNNPGEALLIPAGCWRVLRDFSDDACIGVLASHAYDESDYIRDHDAFKSWQAPQSVPYIDMKRYAQALSADIDTAVQDVVASGHYIGGPAVESFEREFAAYCGAGHAVGVGNGLDALVLTLRALDIGPGASVIAPAHTFIATALAVSHVGAELILVDVDASGNIDVKAAREAIKPNTKAVIPVHLYGNPADMGPIMEMAEKHNLFVIEDAAQAHGARISGKACGAIGTVGCFSFYPTKNLGALGDAGAIVTNDPKLAATLRQLGNYGAAKKYHHALRGTNSRLDPLQAAILQKKLNHLDVWNTRRRTLAARYAAGLSGLNGIMLPCSLPQAEPVWHVYAVQVANEQRDALASHLGGLGIGTNIHYPVPVHLQAAYADLGLKTGAFPQAERIAMETLSLPLDPFHSDQDIDKVIAGVRSFYS